MKNKKNKPFRFGFWLMSRLISRRKNYGLFGDIEEMYGLQVAEKGRWKARLWFWIQILGAILHAFHDSLYWNLVMIQNYGKVTFRNFRSQKTYSLINIAGLAIGMACCILILSYVHWELSYDTYHANSDRIYRLVVKGNINGRAFNIASTNNPPGPFFTEEYPEVEKAVRFRRRQRTSVESENRAFFEDGVFWADASVFDVFSFSLITGNPETALANPFTVVLTESTALKYFGTDDPIGRVLRFDDQADYTITGVMRDVPENSHFTFDMFLSFATRFATDKQQMEKWMGDFDNHTYLLLREDADYRELEKKFPDQVEKHMGETLKIVGWELHYSLQPLSSIHLRSNLDGEIADAGDIAYVYIFSGAALFILFLACINFMNLATARSANRAKEVGVRKVHGAVKGRLIKQFLGESTIFSLISLILAVGVVEVTLPLFRTLSGSEMEIDYFGVPWLIPGLIGLALLVGIGAGRAIPLCIFQASSPPGS